MICILYPTLDQIEKMMMGDSQWNRVSLSHEIKDIIVHPNHKEVFRMRGGILCKIENGILKWRALQLQYWTYRYWYEIKLAIRNTMPLPYKIIIADKQLNVLHRVIAKPKTVKKHLHSIWIGASMALECSPENIFNERIVATERVFNKYYRKQ